MPAPVRLLETGPATLLRSALLKAKKLSKNAEIFLHLTSLPYLQVVHLPDPVPLDMECAAYVRGGEFKMLTWFI